MQYVLPLALLGSGLAAGGLMISVLGGAPLFFVLSTEQYVPVHKFLVTRFDPFMPASLLLGLVCDLALIPLAPTTASRVLVGLGAVLALSTLTVSLTKNVPINRWIATLDPAALPDNFAELDPRERWTRWNKVRASFAFAALLANVAAVAVLL